MQEPTPNEYLLTFSDLKGILVRSKHKIVIGTILCTLMTFLYASTRPVHFEVQASFKEKGRMQTGTSGSLLMSLVGNATSNSEAATIMRSNMLLTKLVMDYSLNGYLSPNRTGFEIIQRIKNNLITELAYWRGKEWLVLPDPNHVLKIKQINYAEEGPLAIQLKFTSGNHFEVISPFNSPPIEGILDQPCTVKNATFILTKNQQFPLESEEYTLIIEPVELVVKRLTKLLNIIVDKEDKNLLKLKLLVSDRQQGKHILNSIMEFYQEYARQEHNRISEEQMSYLFARQDEMQEKLGSMMLQQAAKLSTNALTTGFLGAEAALQFLTNTRQGYSKQILEIDLECQTLTEALSNEEIEVIYIQDGNSPLNPLISSIRSLKKQADSLDLALVENSFTHPSATKVELAVNLEEITQIHQYREDAKALLESITLNQKFDHSLGLYNTPKYRIREWCERLEGTQGDATNGAMCKDLFVNYLHGLMHIFQIQNKALQERLTSQQDNHPQFNGINLESARMLYMEYSKTSDSLEAEILQKAHILQQLQEPSFEITSLSASMQDPITQKMIDKASELVLSLRDQNNRSAKELERLQNDLALQKSFLVAHVQQTIQLIKLHHELMQKKIYLLLNETRMLIHQEISVLKEQFKDFLEVRLYTLLSQKQLLEEQQKKLQIEMSQLPEQRMADILINQQTELNEKMIEEITRLVESKNIARNLELFQSAPLDLAKTPLQSVPPKILLFSFLGAFLGLFASASGSIISSIIKGVPLTEESIKSNGKFTVCGRLTRNLKEGSKKILTDEDLETLRYTVNFIDFKSAESKRVLLLLGNGPDYSKELSGLLAKRGLKVLLMPLSFENTNGIAVNGLLQVLEGTVSEPDILRGKEYDTLPSGGMTKYADELLGNERFETLLKKLEQNYDLIIATNRTPLNQAEVNSLLMKFSKTIITLTDETMQKLKSLLSHSKERALAFMFYDK